MKVEDFITEDERGGYPYYIVECPDGTTMGVWDLEVAEGIAGATMKRRLTDAYNSRTA